MATCRPFLVAEIAAIVGVIAAGGPALLFTNVKGAGFPLVTNLFGTRARAELAFDKETGFELITLANPSRLVIDLPAGIQGETLRGPMRAEEAVPLALQGCYLLALRFAWRLANPKPDDAELSPFERAAAQSQVLSERERALEGEEEVLSLLLFFGRDGVAERLGARPGGPGRRRPDHQREALRLQRAKRGRDAAA